MTDWDLIRERLSAGATDATPDYSLDWIRQHLGVDATKADANQALMRASEWFTAASQEDVLCWYADYRHSNPHAPAIAEDDGRRDVLALLENWEAPVVFCRAVSFQDELQPQL